jgi:hypothetical protein
VVVDHITLSKGKRAGANRQVDHFVGSQELGLDGVDIAPFSVAANIANTLKIGFAHRLTTDVGLAQEFAILIQNPYFVMILLENLLVRPGMTSAAQRKLSPQSRDFRIPFQDFEPRIDQVNAIKQGLQLGGLVDYMDRRGHLAAIVQEGRRS